MDAEREDHNNKNLLECGTPLPFVVILYHHHNYYYYGQYTLKTCLLPTVCLQTMKQISFAKTCPTLLQKAVESGYPSPCFVHVLNLIIKHFWMCSIVLLI